MTPDPRMTVRIAASFSHLTVDELLTVLQNLVLAVQNQFPDPMTDELRDALASARATLAKGVH